MGRKPKISTDRTTLVRTHRSPIIASIHETAEGLHAAGAMDKQTMRRFDATCLTPRHLRAPREQEGASQNGFARHLNDATNDVLPPDQKA